MMSSVSGSSREIVGNWGMGSYHPVYVFVRLRCMCIYKRGRKMSGSSTPYQVPTMLPMSVDDGLKDWGGRGGVTSSVGHLLKLLPVPGAAPSVLVPFPACQPQKNFRHK